QVGRPAPPGDAGAGSGADLDRQEAAGQGSEGTARRRRRRQGARRIPEAGRRLLQGDRREEKRQLMHFAHPLPWWLAILLAGGIAGAAYAQYRRPLAPLATWQRTLLIALRAAALTAIVLFLFRPIAILPPTSLRDAIVPIVVDTSRSMRI